MNKTGMNRTAVRAICILLIGVIAAAAIVIGCELTEIMMEAMGG